MATAFATAFVDQIQALADAQIAKYTASPCTGSAPRSPRLQAQQLPATASNATAANALLTAQINALTQTYSTLQTDQSTLQAGGPYAQIQVAAQPGASTGLSKSKLGAIGLLAGLLVGCGIAFVREQFDDSLRLDPDIESVIDGPLLGELPQDPDVKRGDGLHRPRPGPAVVAVRGRPRPAHQPAGPARRPAEPDRWSSPAPSRATARRS